MNRDEEGRDGSEGEARGFRVEGRVQGVGFRWWTCRTAERLGLEGSVTNRRDGTVEVHARGKRERLDELERALGRGPSGARVSAVREEPSTLPIRSGRFEIVRPRG